MLLCTENGIYFIKYKDKVKNRKVIFTIKHISRDWWNKFLNAYSNLNIRNVVFLNIEITLKCQSWYLDYAVFAIPDELRVYFRQDRKRFNLLFKSSSITVKC